MRKRIATFGKRGNLVRVMETNDAKGRRFVVQWGPSTTREQRSFPGRQGKQEALAFAEAFAAEAGKPKAAAPERPISTRELWLAYGTATFPHLRPRTKQLYKEFWTRWQEFYGADTPAGDLTYDHCAEFRAALERVGLATATIQKTIVCVRSVYNFAERTEKIARNRWHTFRFKVAKERRTQPRAEYRQHEFLAIWKQFDPADRWQWRPYVAIGLLGLYGMRQNAVLHLQWDDIDEQAETLTFRSAFDKQGEQHVLPLLPLARELMAVAQAWREREAYTGPWVLFTGRQTLNKGDTYTIQSLWSALKAAEERAGIDPVRFRAGHGFRRGLVGDLLANGVDIELALKAIGDRDIRMARNYAIKRNERISQALSDRAQLLQPTHEPATNLQQRPETTTAAASVRTRRRAVTTSTIEG
jgi:integrase